VAALITELIDIAFVVTPDEPETSIICRF